MLRTEIAFSADATEDGDLIAANDAGILYIGLGDQFDDDRRLVREPVLAFQLAKAVEFQFWLRKEKIARRE